MNVILQKSRKEQKKSKIYTIFPFEIVNTKAVLEVHSIF